MTPLTHQISGFILATVGGLVLGTGFDLYRTLVRAGYRRWWVSLADFCMWLFGAGIFFLLLLWGHWGEIRFYIFGGLGAGLFAYFRYASQEVRAFWAGMVELIGYLCRTACYVLSWPFVVGYQRTRRLGRWARTKLGPLGRRMREKARRFRRPPPPGPPAGL
ncbi:MAG: spore cortex biosynthesis protein YabQ [Heliobacteriaceae bacterium]|nr:spore cortex biosynthesis protein YabQ [Heliobacteriaceae bacterium]MDD4587653.1 spore cortex biosynthesis protein YabQ [Heliobacteriaceae bacterium]